MIIIGRNSVIEAIKKDRDLDTIYIKSGDKDERLKYIISIAKNKKILIKEVDRKKLDTFAQGENHQGVAASVSEYEYYDFEKLLDDIKVNKEQSKKNFVMILDKIEDPHNLGAIIRSAHLSGVDAIIIPNRRSANVDSTVEKVSVGATSYMKISRVTNLNDTIEKLKKVGLWIYCLDMGNDYYFNTDLTGDIAVVVGNEGRGVSELIRKNSDYVISIPMLGKIDSLNASVASSIVMFEVLRQRMMLK